MIDKSGIVNLRNMLSGLAAARGMPSLKAGAIVKASVVNVHRDGSAVIQLLSGSGSTTTPQQAVVQADSGIPLTKGQTLYLEIMGNKGGLQLKYVGENLNALSASGKDSQQKLIGLLNRLVEMKHGNARPEQLAGVLKTIPQNIKNSIPQLKNLENILQGEKASSNLQNIMQNAKNLLTVSAHAREAILKAGVIIKAEVMKITDKGEALLRILSSDSKDKNIQDTTIAARSAIPLAKGTNIFLEVLRGGTNLKMELINGFKGPVNTSLQQTIPAKLLDALAQLSGARMNNSDFHQLVNMLKSLPDNVKASIPEFQNLEKLILDIQNVDGKVLKAFVETSGVAYETRLKVALMNAQGSILNNIRALQTGGDLKGLLLKLREVIKDQGIIKLMTDAGIRIPDVSGTIERFLNNIEIFQLTSRIDEMFYTFLPFIWEDLRDSEFMFKKNKGNRKGSYTCDINLDFESLGKLSIALTIMNKSFYVTFATEREEIRDLINSQTSVLENRFSAQGMTLKAINVNYKKDITFGAPSSKGVSVTI